MTAANAGKWAEAQARKWLEEKSQQFSDFAYHRYPDARAAQGALAPQPSDFLVGARGHPWHLEVKETANVGRLHHSKIRQRAMLKKYWWAGIQPLVVVYMSEPKLWCYLSAFDLFPGYDDPVSYALKGLMTYTSIDQILSRKFNV